jgi:hypothetical protein
MDHWFIYFDSLTLLYCVSCFYSILADAFINVVNNHFCHFKQYYPYMTESCFCLWKAETTLIKFTQEEAIVLSLITFFFFPNYSSDRVAEVLGNDTLETLMKGGDLYSLWFYNAMQCTRRENVFIRKWLS